MLEKKFAECVKKNALVSGGDRILLAVSGGPDSTALALLLSRFRRLFKIEVHLVYFNHALRRPAEINRDIKIIRGLSRRCAFPMGVVNLDLSARSTAVEERARRLRYERLAAMARAGGFDTVMTAHTADDNAETFLMRLVRGAGVKGLSGIAPSRDFVAGARLVRPLIFFRKKEILNFLARRNVRYSKDSTNRDETFLRNAVRRRLIPALENLNPRAVEHINNLSRIMSAADEFIGAAAARAFGKCVSARRRVLDLKAFFRYNISVRHRIVNLWLEEFNDFHVSSAIDSFLKRPAASKLSVGGYILKKKGNHAFYETGNIPARRH